MRAPFLTLLLSLLSGFGAAEARPAEPAKDQIRTVASNEEELVFFNHQVLVS
jgi:hypothetical protein